MKMLPSRLRFSALASRAGKRTRSGGGGGGGMTVNTKDGFTPAAYKDLRNQILSF